MGQTPRQRLVQTGAWIHHPPVLKTLFPRPTSASDTQPRGELSDHLLPPVSMTCRLAEWYLSPAPSQMMECQDTTTFTVCWEITV